MISSFTFSFVEASGDMGGFSIGFVVTVTILASIQAKSPNLNDVLFNGDYDIIDLTYPFDNNTIYWKNGRHFEFIKIDESFRKDGTW